MRFSGLVRFVVVAMLAIPLVASAQEATLTGVVRDTTGGVLPGVTVTSVHEASGNSVFVVTDVGGAFRIPLRIGAHRVTVELTGFASVARTLSLLVGQQAVLDLQLSPAGVQESVTVTGEAPLINVSQSTLGGNVDPRQMTDLPVNGRNWQDLVVLAPGNRANAVDDRPTARERADYQINMDGQQITQDALGGSQGQPGFSRDAIAEFQFIGSRFDATQGRSSGVQVNAVSKSGTNVFGGSVSGYFRSDRFNARDLVADRVLPYSNQQMSTTFGGPILQNRAHFFANYEYERNPQTAVFSTPVPQFNIDLTGTNRKTTIGARLDFQLPRQTHFMTRLNRWTSVIPMNTPGGAIRHPASADRAQRNSEEVFMVLTQVLSNRALNEIKGGYANYVWQNTPIPTWPNHPAASTGITTGPPTILFRNFTIAQGTANPQRFGQQNYSMRDDFTYSFEQGGRHDIKLGGEHILIAHDALSCRNCAGTIDASNSPIPANIADILPVWNDVSTWNLAALSSITRQFTIGVGNMAYQIPRHVTAAWLQDDWNMGALTLNLGLRYDLSTNLWANSRAVEPWLSAGRPNNTTNFGPRLGFVYRLNDRTVVRGGAGKYFGDVLNNTASGTTVWSQAVGVNFLNDGRSDFASNPFNGSTPTFEQALALPGLRRTAAQLVPPPLYAQVPYSWQGSIGFQRQIGATMSVQADYSTSLARKERYDHGNANVTYDPSTGLNYPFTNLARVVDPKWGTVGRTIMDSRSDYHGLETAFTKRFSGRWQASATYTFSRLKDADPMPFSGNLPVTFAVAPDLGGEYSLATTDQRHRAVLNGVVELPFAFQVSGLYFFGSGQRYATSFGGDLRGLGVAGTARLRTNGAIVPRNNFTGDAIHRVDIRIQRRVRIGRVAIDPLLEVFNAFNYANFGAFTTAESNARYGLPVQNTNVAYGSRALQLGIRTTF